MPDEKNKKAPREMRNQSKSIRRALSILDTLAMQAEGANLVELNRATGIPKPTISRILSVFVETKYARQDSRSGLYFPGWRILQISSSVLNSMELRSKARPYLLRLMEQVQETINLGTLYDSQLMYIDRIDSVRTVRLYSVVGKCVPAHCTALGKAILAFADESVVDRIVENQGLGQRTERTICDPAALKGHLGAIRHSGIAVDDEEYQEGVRCIAAPVFGRHDTSAVGAISVSGPITRMDGEHLQESTCHLRAAAREISHELGWPL